MQSQESISNYTANFGLYARPPACGSARPFRRFLRFRLPGRFGRSVVPAALASWVGCLVRAVASPLVRLVSQLSGTPDVSIARLRRLTSSIAALIRRLVGSTSSFVCALGFSLKWDWEPCCGLTTADCDSLSLSKGRFIGGRLLVFNQSRSRVQGADSNADCGPIPLVSLDGRLNPLHSCAMISDIWNVSCRIYVVVDDDLTPLVFIGPGIGTWFIVESSLPGVVESWMHSLLLSSVDESNGRIHEGVLVSKVSDPSGETSVATESRNKSRISVSRMSGPWPELTLGSSDLEAEPLFPCLGYHFSGMNFNFGREH
jgi:hypothetical protein